MKQPRCFVFQVELIKCCEESSRRHLDCDVCSSSIYCAHHKNYYCINNHNGLVCVVVLSDKQQVPHQAQMLLTDCGLCRSCCYGTMMSAGSNDFIIIKSKRIKMFVLSMFLAWSPSHKEHEQLTLICSLKVHNDNFFSIVLLLITHTQLSE